MKSILVSHKLVWTQFSWTAIVISALTPVIKSLANIVSHSLTGLLSLQVGRKTGGVTVLPTCDWENTCREASSCKHYPCRMVHNCV